MSNINPLLPSPPVAQTAALPAATAEERQVDLRLEQVVRATVVEGGLDRALLEMNHRHYRAQSDLELQVGQKLTLQVLQIHPTLEMRVLRDPFAGKLGQLLPLLNQPFDWSGLLERLQQAPQVRQSPELTQLYQQLQQVLQPNGRLPATLEGGLAKLPEQLQQLFAALVGRSPEADPTSLASPAARAYLYYQANRPASSVPSELTRQLRGLQEQLLQLQQAADRPPTNEWLSATRQQLTALSSQLTQLPPQAPQLDNLFTLLGQFRLQANLPPAIQGELEQLQLQLTVQRGGASVEIAAPVTAQAGGSVPQSAGAANETGLQGQAARSSALASDGQLGGDAPLPSGGKAAVQPAPAQAVSSRPGAVVPAELSQELTALLREAEQLHKAKGSLTPELLGRLEGLYEQLRRLPLEPAAASPLPGLEPLSAQLAQLISQSPQRPDGAQLGFLSQLFGFHLEAELLKGKQKEALRNLKASLLALQQELGDEVKEPLQRLEMLQLCKARLAEEQLQFLPLPFPELEEGYLLLEPADEQKTEQAERGEPLHLSLSLRLSALGNLRFDLLYDPQGLHLRMACEDQERMAYLQEHRSELEEAIETVPLRGVSFAADAGEPARLLLERLFPEALGMLDERI